MYKTLVYPYGGTDVYDEPYEVEPGSYRLTSGIRLKDGTVRVRFTYFTVRAGDTARVALTYRETAVDIPVLGTLSPGSTLTRLDGTGANLKDLLGSEGALAPGSNRSGSRPSICSASSASWPSRWISWACNCADDRECGVDGFL